MGNDVTDWSVLGIIAVVFGIGGYVLYRQDKNSEGQKDFEPVTKTIKSMFRSDSIGGSATKHYKKKHSKGKTYKKH